MTGNRVRAAALSIGVDARAALWPGAHGVVIAAFRRSACLRLPGGVVCIGDTWIGEGPINILCQAAPGRDWREIAEVGAEASIAGDLVLLPGVEAALTPAGTWSPRPPPRTDAVTLAAGLSALAEELPPDLPAGGLGVLLAPGGAAEDDVARAAAPAVVRLAAWLGDGVGCARAFPEDAARSLLGLGPGLTPSGDDYLAGVAVGLRSLGAHRHHARLAEAVAALAGECTNEISAAHLAAALRGRLRADLHLVIDAVLAADRGAIASGLRRLRAEDHHSPWDALAGFAAAARACCGGLAATMGELA